MSDPSREGRTQITAERAEARGQGDGQVVQREELRLRCLGRGGEDLLVHHTAIEGEGYRNLEDERVGHEPTRGRKGEQAVNVRRVE